MKLEFADFYKFVTSLGVVLIGLAFFVPWLFLSQPFDLLVEANRIKLLTETAQSVIIQRQLAIQFMLRIIPPFSWTAIGLGALLLTLGGYFWWRKTQRISDLSGQAKLDFLLKQLHSVPAAELKERTDESQEEAEEQPSPPTSKLTELPKFSVVAFERKLCDKLSDCFRVTHDVYADQRLGPVVFDYLLLAKSDEQPDYAIETKHIRIGFKYGWLRDNAIKQVFAGQLLHKESDRLVIPVLIVVAPNDVLQATPTSDYIQRIRRDMILRYSNIVVSFLPREDMEKIKCEQIRNLVA